MLTIFVVILALFAGNMNIIVVSCAESPTPAFDYVDGLMRPDVISDDLSEGSPPGYGDTSEYLIGDVAVGIIFLESNGTIDPSTEDWTLTKESKVINEINEGLTRLVIISVPIECLTLLLVIPLSCMITLNSVTSGSVEVQTILCFKKAPIFRI